MFWWGGEAVEGKGRFDVKGLVVLVVGWRCGGGVGRWRGGMLKYLTGLELTNDSEEEEQGACSL